MSETIFLDGGDIEYKVQGNGPGTIVFLNGGGADFDMSWSEVAPKTTEFGVVIQYNLPGIGRSSKQSTIQTGKVVVDSLLSLLNKLELKPPYFLVAHSLGGLYANLFARLYPKLTRAVVFVDSSHPDQFEKLKSTETIYLRLLFWSIRTFARKSAIAQAFNIDQEIISAGEFPPVPIIVLTGMKQEAPNWMVNPAMLDQKLLLHKELAELSPKSQHIITKKSGHNIAIEEPELVINSIQKVCSYGHKNT